MLKQLAGISTRSKMTAILLSLLVPVAMLFYFDMSQSLSTIQVAQREDIGNDWESQLVDVARNLAEHRDRVVRVAAGHEEERAEMDEHRGLVEASVRQLDALDATDAGGLKASADWAALRKDVLGAVTSEIKTPDNFGLHNEAIRKVLDSVQRLAFDSGLSLDPDTDSFSLVNALIMRLPTGLQGLALARRHFDSINEGDTSSRIRLQLGTQLGVAESQLEAVFTTLTREYAAAAPEDKATIESAVAAQRSFESLLPTLRTVGEGARLASAETAAASEKTKQLTEALADVQDKGLQKLELILNRRVAGAKHSMYTHLGITLLCLAFSVSLALWVTRYLSSQVSKANAIFDNMSRGKLDSEVGEQVGDELGVLLRSLDRMQGELRTRLESERVVAQENSRILQSLDATSANVMVADDNYQIIYLNRAAGALMANAQQDFRGSLPGFDASKILGGSIDVFHRNPSHQREMLDKLAGTHVSEMKIGSRSMRIIANPIFDESRKRLGTVVEWIDRTQELAVEAEVQQIVGEALEGNLDRRIAMEGKTGFFKSLSADINELVATMSTVVTEVQTLVAAANDGNLGSRISLDGRSGLLVKIGTGINQLAGNMEIVVDEVQALVAAANDGDLTCRIELEGQSGLMVKLGSGINELAGNMASIVSQVKEAAGEVSRGADEISQGNTNLSQRTEEQASSLEETASSMEEMTSTVRQNADNAGAANQLAMAARDQAEKGGSEVAKAVKAMADINDASRRIADIIGVIDDIAFQTNLLALNAAVEAARAGEQGRGFAVVASEVRNLAGRSATAAKEIKSLIQDSVRKVDEGSSLVTQSGATLEQIVTSVKKVTDIVAEIAAASQEQSLGIEQVNKAVMQLDELTQQNAALVEEASASSQSMADQARGLNKALQRYKVDSKGQDAPIAAARPVSTLARRAGSASRVR